jgi:hypothetical protein
LPPHLAATAEQKAKDKQMVRPVPGWLFPPLFFAGVGILLAGGVQWQVGRIKRTNFNDQLYIEDSSLGTAVCGVT